MFIIIRMTNCDNDRTIAYMGKFDALDEAQAAMARGAHMAKDEYLVEGYDEEDVDVNIRERTAVVSPDPDELDGAHWFIFDTDEGNDSLWMFPAF